MKKMIKIISATFFAVGATVQQVYWIKEDLIKDWFINLLYISCYVTVIYMLLKNKKIESNV